MEPTAFRPEILSCVSVMARTNGEEPLWIGIIYQRILVKRMRWLEFFNLNIRTAVILYREGFSNFTTNCSRACIVTASFTIIKDNNGCLMHVYQPSIAVQFIHLFNSDKVEIIRFTLVPGLLSGSTDLLCYATPAFKNCQNNQITWQFYILYFYALRNKDTGWIDFTVCSRMEARTEENPHRSFLCCSFILISMARLLSLYL